MRQINTVTTGTVLIHGDESSDNEQEKYLVDVEDPDKIVEIAVEEVQDISQVQRGDNLNQNSTEGSSPGTVPLNKHRELKKAKHGDGKNHHKQRHLRGS